MEKPKEPNHYCIGQMLTAAKDLTLEGCMGSKKEVPKGTRIWIGADSFAHHRDGTIQPLAEGAVVEKYSVSGLAEFIWSYLRAETALGNTDMLEDYEETESNIKETIMEALEELGFYDNTGNRS